MAAKNSIFCSLAPIMLCHTILDSSVYQNYLSGCQVLLSTRQTNKHTQTDKRWPIKKLYKLKMKGTLNTPRATGVFWGKNKDE